MSGAALVDAEEVRAAAGLLGRNAFLASATEAGAAVRALPAVRDARARVLLPDRARVEVEERRAAIAVDAGGRRLYADEGGVLFAAATALTDLPGLADETARRAPGERIDPAVVRTARAVAALGPGYFGRRVERLRLAATHGLVATLEGGTDVRLGGPEQLEAKLEAARRVVLARAGKRLDYVDARSLDGITYFPVD